MSKINDISLHIAMYAWFAMGHLIPFLNLANKLAERGHKISFFLPAKTQPKLSAHNHHPNLITFVLITVPHVDGLPIGAETTNDVPQSGRPKIMDAMDLTKDTIDSHLARLKPDYIFFDYTHWTPRLARKHGAKSIYYSSNYMITMAYLSFEGRNLPINHHLTETDLMEPPPGMPCQAIRLKACESRVLAMQGNMEYGGGMTIPERHSISFKECDIVAHKTCREMEGVYCDFTEKVRKRKIHLVGPLVPEPPSSQLAGHLNDWLNGFGHGSVVYCALGSECVLEKDQFQELVLGLELTGKPFLAALKPPNGCETIESALPEGYAERTKDRGIIHGGWVQQQLILHHPSVGCFITHCGAGSLSEGLCSKCQLVLLPQGADQFTNARLMSIDLRVGVEVSKGEEDGVFTRNDICDAVNKVMEPECEIGREVRANHAKWRDILLKPGLEDFYISKFVDTLVELRE